MLGLTEHIRIHDNVRHGPSPSSKPRGREQRRQGPIRPSIHRARYKTVQVSMVHAVLCRSVHFDRSETRPTAAPCVWYTQDPTGEFPTKGDYNYDGVSQMGTWTH